MSSAVSQSPRVDMLYRLVSMVNSAEFPWFAGQLVAAIYGTLFIASSLLNNPDLVKYYRTYTGILVSYGVILYKIFKSSPKTNIFLAKVLNDESAVCLMLAVISISINSAAVTIAPFVVFSYINMLVFIRTKLASEASTSSKGAKTVERLLLLFTRTFHSKILRLVAYYEALIVIPAVIISALRGQSSPIVAFIYIKLFTFRYACSIYLRMAYNDIGKVLSFIFDNPYSPKIVSNIYRKSVDLLISACGTGLSRTRTSCS